MITGKAKIIYYKFGEIRNEVISLSGFGFKVLVMEKHDGVSVQIEDTDSIPLKSFYVVDLGKLYFTVDAMRNVINEWIEENTDKQDRLTDLVMK